MKRPLSIFVALLCLLVVMAAPAMCLSRACGPGCPPGSMAHHPGMPAQHTCCCARSAAQAAEVVTPPPFVPLLPAVERWPTERAAFATPSFHASIAAESLPPPPRFLPLRI